MANMLTLELAELTLHRKGLVDDGWVDALDLFIACGYKTSNISQTNQRMIEAHKLGPHEYRTVTTPSVRGRPSIAYQFTINSARHILLSALTKPGKIARQGAIDFMSSSPAELLQYVSTLIEDIELKDKILATRDEVIKSLDSQIKDMMSYLTDDVTVHEFSRTLHGVNSMMVSRYLSCKGWLRGHPQAWRTTSYARDRYVRELLVDTRNGPRVKILLTKAGSKILMEEYRKGLLPMRKGM
jgi:phage anti-repressor protein